MSTKKYEIVKSNSIVCNGRTLYRIRALRDFNTVTGETVFKGDLGGFIETENNLSQEGYCWIFNNAKIYENAIVAGDVQIYHNAQVYGNAWIYDDTFICDNARIYGFAKIFNKAIVYGNAKVYGNAQIFGKAKVYGNAEVYENAEIFDYAFIFGVAKIGGDKIIKEGNYFFKSFTDIEALNEIKTVCYKISFAVRVIELKLPIEQGYIESLVSQFAEYNELADSFLGRTYLSPKEKEILAMLSQCKKDVKILKKVKWKRRQNGKVY